MSKADFKTKLERLRAWVGPVFVLVMLVAALWLLQRELKHHTLQDFIDSIRKIPIGYLIVAVLLTVLNYAILVCYDWLGIWYIRHPMKFGRVALASFLGYAVGNNFGLLFGGSTIRYRLYSSWGLSTSDIVRLLFILAITFWIGLFALSGIVFLVNPMPIPEALSNLKLGPINITLPFETTRPVGWVLTFAASMYLLFCLLRRKPLKFKNVDCSPPPVGLALMQYLVASIDLIVAAGVLYALLCSVIPDLEFFHFVTIFLLAQVAVFVTQVPGGIGVLELSIIALLGEDEAVVFGALLAYRMIFYLTPMLIGLLLLVAHEVTANRTKLKPAFETLSRWTPDIAPRLLTFNAFASGVVLTLAAATPSTNQRISQLNNAIPMWGVDLAYILSAVTGVGLMVVARGVLHRVVSSFWVTLALYGAGLIFALSGSLSIEVSVFLMLMTVAHAPCRHYFFREDVTFPDRISITWLTFIFVVIGVGFWLMWFAYKEISDYGFGLIWQSDIENHAARSLRALLLSLVSVSVYYLVRWLFIYLRHPKLVSKKDLQAATEIVRSAKNTYGHTSLLGDKRILMNAEKTAMISYGIRGPSWVAASDPVGPREDALQIAWDFFELCKSGDNWPVFFTADKEWLDVYSEMGLEVTKIAQEARVDLRTFDVQSAHRKEFGETLERFEQENIAFRVIQPPDVNDQLPLIRRISDIWLKDKNLDELGFSIPYFSEDRVKDFPVGIAERNGEAIGFATIWPSVEQREVAVGLLRYLPDLPAGIIEYLFINAMNWGKAQGFKTFNLGVAPLMDDQAQQESPFRTELASIPFQHSRHVYTRSGLRNFKERFDPTWHPKYLASPGGYAIKTILENIGDLIVSGSEKTDKRN